MPRHATTRPPATRDPEPAPVRVHGFIIRLVANRGFGFIVAPDGAEYFFHSSSVLRFDDLTEGDAVTFLPTSGAKGPRAEAVQMV